jgi:hypothetical protein
MVIDRVQLVDGTRWWSEGKHTVSAAANSTASTGTADAPTFPPSVCVMSTESPTASATNQNYVDYEISSFPMPRLLAEFISIPLLSSSLPAVTITAPSTSSPVCWLCSNDARSW